MKWKGKVKPLCIMPPNISGFRKKLGKMFFVVKDDNFLQNYDTIWD